MLQTAQGLTAGLLQRNPAEEWAVCLPAVLLHTWHTQSPVPSIPNVSSLLFLPSFLSWAIPPEPAGRQHCSHKQHEECEKTMKVVGNNINKLTPLEVGFVPLPLGFCKSTLTKSAPQEGTCKPQPSSGLPVQLARTAWHEIKRQVGSLSAWSCPQLMSQKLTSPVLEVEA